MQPVSVVIIAKNESENIAEAIRSALQITDEVLVVDTGSTDDTVKISEGSGARVIQPEWLGFGATRNFGAINAKHEWVFALDADERIDASLAASVNALQLNKQHVYGFKRKNFLYGTPVYYGEWGRDVQYRLYNKNSYSYTEVPVHETIDAPASLKKIINGSLLHLTMKNEDEYKQKTERYAALSAEKYFEKGKKAASYKKMFSPIFSFIQNYIFRLGFLDGKAGLTIASMSAKYSRLKYKLLEELQQQHKN